MTASLVTSICNSALDRLGQRSVTFAAAGHLASPVNDLERICARNFDDTAKVVLASHPWNCVTAREDLSVDADDPPAFQFDNRFPFPTDQRVCRLVSVWLDGVEIKTDEDTRHYGDFRVEGQSIITNAEAVQVEFITYPIQASLEESAAFDTRMETYFGQIDDALKQVLIKKLALELCYPVTNNATLKAALGMEYEESWRKALGKNKRENPLPRFANRDLINARWSY